MTKQIFRVHYEDWQKLNIPADSSDEARRIAKKKYGGIIVKIKRDRQKEAA